jgi:hypothetical protein
MMDVKVPIKIHNKFEIEVIDVISGEIVQRGFAENAVLESLFSNIGFMGEGAQFLGYSLHFGNGSGTITPSRTTLFNRLGSKIREDVELVINQTPVASYSTKKSTILPAEYIGETFTEVGIGGALATTTIGTHALIKDSEGNLLPLGPKTATQEIIIYSTVYFQPNFEPGIILSGILTDLNEVNSRNGLLAAALLHNWSNLIVPSFSYVSRLIVNDLTVFNKPMELARVSGQPNLFRTALNKLLTSEGNGKIKSVASYQGTSGTYGKRQNSIKVDFTILAENNSMLWNGHNFDKTAIGVGDGTKTLFNLTWDEVWLEKPKKLYVDGVEVTNGVTWSAGSIQFTTAPAIGAVITADYWVKYIPKDSNHELWLTFEILFGEGAPE